MLSFRDYLLHMLTEGQQTFRQHISQLLSEGNPLGRLRQHVAGGRSFSTISAERSHLSSSENKSRMKELKQKVREMGYGYKKARGRWQGGSEASLVVHAKGAGKSHGRRLTKDMNKLGKHFDQDAVLHHGGKGSSAGAHLQGTNKSGWPGKNRIAKTGRVAYNRPKAENETVLRSGKKKSEATFTTTND